MKIAIIGSGGVGGYFGGKLAQGGNEVIFIARGEHLKALQKDGLIVNSISGNFRLDKIVASDDIKAAKNANLYIIAVKAWQVNEIAGKIKNLIAPDSVIMPLQNGVMAADELKGVLPAHNVIKGLCRIISRIEAPGVINHFGVEPAIIFGESDNSTTPRILAIRQMFLNSGVQAIVPADINAELWKKFISICVSGLLAVTKTTYGELRSLPETRQMMIELLMEVYNVSQKLKISIKPDFVGKTVAFIDSFPPDTTSSLTRDVLEGKPSELEYQNGAVVRFGKQLGVPTPINSFVYYSILPSEIKARKK